MKKTTALLAFIAFVGNYFAQGRLVINNNCFLVISNGAKLVVENAATNAITVGGTGANIVSEGATNQLVWNIGAGTGTYTVPWTTLPVVQGGNSTKIPYTMNITTAGSSGGQFVMSTYETATDVNTPFPAGVTTLASPALGGADASLYVIDRFWINDNSSYGTKPAATLSFAYDDATNELGGTNTALEANLLAQRWNPTGSGSWELLQFGSTNTGTNTTSGINVTATNFWPIWTLVDLNFPLPVFLESQNATNSGCRTLVTWTTTSQTNNDYFTINRSINGVDWQEIGRVEGAGNINETMDYSFLDPFAMAEPTKEVYYKIGQVDFNGTPTYFPIMKVETNCQDFKAPQAYPNPFSNELVIKNSGKGTANMYDASGRLVKSQNIDLVNNVLDLEFLASGMYQLNLEVNNEQYQFKLIKH